MRLVDKLLGRPEGQLPTVKETRHFANPKGAGSYFAEAATLYTEQALRDLTVLPNADRATKTAVISSAVAVIDMARELDALDGALLRATTSKLAATFDESATISYWQARTRVESYKLWRLDGVGRMQDDERTAVLRQWVKSLPEPQHSEMQALVKRRQELRPIVREAYQDFVQTVSAIEKAAQKMQAINAAATVDRDDVPTRHSELGIEQVAQAQELVSALTAGVDEAYQAAGRPDLSGLGAPSVFTPSPESGPALEH